MSIPQLPVSLSAALRDAAEAAVATLATEPMAAGMAGEGTELHEFVPGERARAVTARLSGLEAELSILLSADVAASIEDGPLGRQELVAAVTPGLERAAEILESVAGVAITVEVVQEVEADVALLGADGSEGFDAIPLFIGDGHVASVALVLAPSERADGVTAAAPTSAGGAEVAPEASPGADLPAASWSEPGHDVPAVGLVPASAVAAAHSLRLLHDVEMSVTAELGRTKMTVRNLLSLLPGSVIELDRSAGAPIDLMVNGTLIARGEVVVIDEEFGVRVSEIVERRDD